MSTPTASVPASPTGLNLVGTSVKATLTWSPVPSNMENPDPPVEYIVEVIQLNGQIAGRVVATTNWATIDGLIRGWSYKVYVWVNGSDALPAILDITV